MERILYFLLIIQIAVTSCNDPKSRYRSVEKAINTLTADEFLNHMAALSSDEMMGRETGTPGFDSASNYIIEQLKLLDLKPGGINHTYKQPIDLRSANYKKETITVSINGDELEIDTEYIMWPYTEQEEIEFTAPLVFAGFGIEAPELNYNDLENLDLKGKVALVIGGAPSAFSDMEKAVISRRKTVQNTLIAKGAIGIITIYPRDSYTWPTLRHSASKRGLGYVTNNEKVSSIPGLMLNYVKGIDLLNSIGIDYQTLLNKITEGEPASFDLGINVSIKAKIDLESKPSHNVAAFIEGSDPILKNEFLIISAHLDHIGIGWPVNGDSIYNGSLDNASGASAILMLADLFSNMKTPKRSVLFLWVTGEEVGLLGSDYFARNPTIGLSSIVANQNIDMITGVIQETTDVIAYGYEHSNLSQSVDYAVDHLGMELTKDPYPEENFFVRSDQYSFVTNGYPAIWCLSGTTATNDSNDGNQKIENWWATRYHQLNDDMSQPMDHKGIEKELKLNFLVAYHIANLSESINWNKDNFLYDRFGE